MQPRLIFRTHYQVDEPAYVEFLIQSCTSAVRGTDGRGVAACLKDEVERRTRRRFNVAAAGYAIDLGKELGLLTPYHTWTERGHLVNLVAEVGRGEPERQLALNPAERVLHFRLFIEADGAALVLLAQYLKRRGSISQSDVIKSTFIEELFSELYEEYLALTADPDERKDLKERIEYLQTKGYAGETGQGRTRQHKLRLHVQTLYRLGLIQRIDRPRGLAFRSPLKGDDIDSSPRELLQEAPDIQTLETRLARGEWATMAANALAIEHVRPVELTRPMREFALEALARSYPEVMSSGVPQCPLGPVLEAVQIRALAEQGWLWDLDAIGALVDEEARRRPDDVRVLSRRGQPHAAVRLSDRWVRAAVGW